MTTVVGKVVTALQLEPSPPNKGYPKW